MNATTNNGASSMDTITLIDALMAAGHTVESTTTGAVYVDDELCDAWDMAERAWSGTIKGLEDLGW